MSGIKSNVTAKAPVIAVCHGGGPLPALGDPAHKALIASLQTKAPQVLGIDDQGRNDKGLKGIVLVTAHWTAKTPTISNAERPQLLYDYGGFQRQAYALKYDAPGSPIIANQVHALLSAAGFEPQMDSRRGWDHGVFVPLLLIHPSASIPIVQISLSASSSVSTHYRMGQALSPLRSQSIAILGSGMPSFHNLKLFFSATKGLSQPDVSARNAAWSEKLTSVLEMEGDEERTMNELDNWRTWTGAEEAHPRGREEHLWPLMVCAGAARGEGASWWQDELVAMGNHRSYYWT